MKKINLFFLSLLVLLVMTAEASAGVLIPDGIYVDANDLDGDFTVSWGASATPGPGVTYELQEAINANFTMGRRTVVAGVGDLSAAIFSRTSSVTYYYRVRAAKAGIYSNWLKAANGCLIGPLPCEQPVSIDVSGIDVSGNYLVEWGASPTEGVRYTLQEATTANFKVGLRSVYLGRLFSFSIAITDRHPGTTYYYRVRATKSGLPPSAYISWITGITIPAIPAPVPKTGQTFSYGAGDDGALQKGVASPDPRFTDKGDGTVVDNLTGLIWLKTANCDLFHDHVYNPVTELMEDTPNKTWSDALTSVNNLAHGQCGLTDNSIAGDWRLPNAKELSSLMNLKYSRPALSDSNGTGQWSPGNPFADVKGVVEGEVESYYWSSSTYIDVTAGAWSVDMYDGYMSSIYKTDNCYVWPVRDGQ
ncbi:MAG: hypothetical protein A2511_17435 [Deltaproteobacteria bacterium RIFOXYD12_FULL_50_9]|nr:MAG: hypothetical protein A2511_17435 [Deltaproteobacteria bacterium RIFOXYD12_FULL_50_9]